MDFGIIGVGGYVAPRHLQAIKDTGNNLVVAYDKHDSVGILDRYFPDCKFFTTQEQFDRHIVKYENLDYISVCSPNYLHESHCKLGMRLGANVICEKPLATTLENLEQLEQIEAETNKKVYSILQLRLHPAIIKLKKQIENIEYNNVVLDYVTPRGNWYHQSWKGDIKKSGGIETNIGIHFFDILIYLFGDVVKFNIIDKTNTYSIGTLYLERATVKWRLSINRRDLPGKSLKFFRNMLVNNQPINFDNVFSELHTTSYNEILKGNGFGITESKKAIKLVEKIRTTQ